MFGEHRDRINLGLGTTAAALLFGGYLFMQDPDEQYRKEQAEAASGKPSSSESFKDSLPFHILDKAAKAVNRGIHYVSDKAEEAHDEVLTCGVGTSPADRIYKIENYIINPWLEQGFSASLTKHFVAKMQSNYPELLDQNCSITIYKVDRSSGQYRTNEALLESVPGNSKNTLDIGHSSLVYDLRVVYPDGTIKDKFFRLHTVQVSKGKFNFIMQSCESNNCITDTTPPEVTNLDLVNSGTTYWERGKSIPMPNSNEDRRASVMRQAEEAQNYNQHYRLTQSENPNRTFRSNNIPAENYPPKQKVTAAPLESVGVPDCVRGVDTVIGVHNRSLSANEKVCNYNGQTVIAKK